MAVGQLSLSFRRFWSRSLAASMVPPELKKDTHTANVLGNELFSNIVLQLFWFKTGSRRQLALTLTHSISGQLTLKLFFGLSPLPIGFYTLSAWNRFVLRKV